MWSMRLRLPSGTMLSKHCVRFLSRVAYGDVRALFIEGKSCELFICLQSPITHRAFDPVRNGFAGPLTGGVNRTQHGREGRRHDRLAAPRGRERAHGVGHRSGKLFHVREEPPGDLEHSLRYCLPREYDLDKKLTPRCCGGLLALCAIHGSEIRQSVKRSYKFVGFITIPLSLR